jgi:hypothetical protein
MKFPLSLYIVYWIVQQIASSSVKIRTFYKVSSEEASNQLVFGCARNCSSVNCTGFDAVSRASKADNLQTCINLSGVNYAGEENLTSGYARYLKRFSQVSELLRNSK